MGSHLVIFSIVCFINAWNETWRLESGGKVIFCEAFLVCLHVCRMPRRSRLFLALSDILAVVPFPLYRNVLYYLFQDYRVQRTLYDHPSLYYSIAVRSMGKAWWLAFGTSPLALRPLPSPWAQLSTQMFLFCDVCNRDRRSNMIMSYSFEPMRFFSVILISAWLFSAIAPLFRTFVGRPIWPSFPLSSMQWISWVISI